MTTLIFYSYLVSIPCWILRVVLFHEIHDAGAMLVILACSPIWPVVEWRAWKESRRTV